jgi:thiol:disulfide interchange protein
MAIGWGAAAVFFTFWGFLLNRPGHWMMALVLLGACLVRLLWVEVIQNYSHIGDFKPAFALACLCFFACSALHAWKRIKQNGKL